MGVTSEELIERARAIAPRAEARAREVEDRRAPHDDTIAEMIDAELIQTLVPRRWGGHELGIETHVEIVEILSAACLSTGWIAAFYLGHNWFVTKLPEKAQAEIFASRPFALIPVATAPTIEAVREGDGFRISGRAAWGSGIVHADWVMVAGLVPDEGPYLFTLPIEDVSMEDTWHFAGMSGTGSNDMIVREAYVPDHRAVDMIEFASGETPGSALHASPLYSMPLLPFLYMEALPVFTGGLRGATAAYDAIVQSRVTTHARTKVADQQHAHVLLGGAVAKANVAEILVREQVRQTQEIHARAGFDVEARIRLKGQASFLVEHCRSAASEMMQHAGANAFRSDAPLQRFYRDLNMLAAHAFWEWDGSREQVGRHAVGLEVSSPLV